MSEYLKTSELTESRAFIHSFIKEIEVRPGKATIHYTIPMPNDGVTSESASVLDFVKSSPPGGIRTPDTRVRSPVLYPLSYGRGMSEPVQYVSTVSPRQGGVRSQHPAQGAQSGALSVAGWLVRRVREELSAAIR